MANSAQHLGRTSRMRLGASEALILAGALMLGVVALPSAQAQTFTVLYNFTGAADGANPVAAVIRDAAGNLYSTTYVGGDPRCNAPSGCGVVFELSTGGAETVLYTFEGANGAQPGAPLLRDNSGNLYGTTIGGGRYSNGVIFKISPAGKEVVLHSFSGGTKDGCNPYDGLARDKYGSLYGTTSGCGTFGKGTVFKLPKGGKETLLHSFAGGPSDGTGALNGNLLIDKYGSLYGLTANGGDGACQTGCGTLYKLSNKGKLTLLHSFEQSHSDGCFPSGTLVMDGFGNMYGTAYSCGLYSGGVVWKVSKTGVETILHSFAGGASDGRGPSAGVVRDARGNLYGDTSGGGAYNDGTVYKVSKNGKLTLLHSFSLSDGSGPDGELLRDANGVLYSTTCCGGSYGFGTVWSYVP